MSDKCKWGCPLEGVSASLGAAVKGVGTLPGLASLQNLAFDAVDVDTLDTPSPKPGGRNGGSHIR